MKLIRHVDTKVVSYMLANDAYISLGSELIADGIKALDITSDTHEIVTGIAAPAVFVGGALTFDGEWQVVDQAAMDSAAAKSEAALAALKAQLADGIDNRVAAILAKWLRFSAGYDKREAAARAFKSANYTGDAGVWVTSFATAAKKTPTEATNLIIYQADGLKKALEDLENLRMQKYDISFATTSSAAQAEFDRITSEINRIAAGL